MTACRNGQMAEVGWLPTIGLRWLDVRFGRSAAFPAMGSAPKRFPMIADPILYDLFR